MLRLNPLFYAFVGVALGIIISSLSGYIIYSSEDIASTIAAPIATPIYTFTSPFSNTTAEYIVSITWPFLAGGLVGTGISSFFVWRFK